MFELKVANVDDEGVVEVDVAATFVDVVVVFAVVVVVAVGVGRFCFDGWTFFSPFRDSKFFKIPLTGGEFWTENDL